MNVVWTALTVCLVLTAGQLSAAEEIVTGGMLLERPIDVELDPTDLDRSLLKIAQATGAVLQIDSPRTSEGTESLPKRLKAVSLREGLKTIAPSLDRMVNVTTPGQSRVPPEPKPEERSVHAGTWMVRGRVVDEAGQRLSRAMIRASCWPTTAYATTDQEGRFAVRLTAWGALTVHAWDELGQRQAWVHLPKEDGAVVEEPMKLVLREPRPITVRVSDLDGKAVAGARVVVMAGGYPTEAPRTGSDGQSVLLSPESMAISCIVAWKPGVGLEMAGSETGSSDRDSQPGVDVAVPVVLKLTGRPPIAFRVVDSNGRPLEGIDITPFILTDEKRKAGLNFATLRGRGSRKTGANGVVTFDWLPQWQTTPVQFMGFQADRILYIDQTFDPSNPGEQPIKIVRDEFVSLSGIVLNGNGKPCRGAVVTTVGHPLSRGEVTTDETGRYELFLEPGRPFLIVARSADNDEVSAPQDGVVVRHGEPARNLTLQLRPAIRLYGSLGPARMRNGRADAQLRLVSDVEPSEPAVADQAKASRPKKAGISIDLKPNNSGQFEALVGPGGYEIIPDQGGTPIRFILTDEDEYKLHLPQPQPATPALPARPMPGRRPD